MKNENVITKNANNAKNASNTAATATATTTDATTKTMKGMRGVKGSGKWSEIRTLPLNVLRIDTNYQRDLNLSRVRYIVNNFDPDLVGIPQVSYRDGKLFVFDGQHTIKALSLVKNDPAYPIVCKVYYGLSGEEEAGLFHKFNTSRMPINAISIIKAQAAYGDEKIKSFLQCTKSAGFIIDPTKPRNCRYGIRAVRTALNCFSSLGAENYKFMLDLLRRTWRGERWSLNQNMLNAMELLLRVFWHELHKIDDFAKKMSRFTDNDINKEAANFYEMSNPYRYAWALGSLYNKRTAKAEQDGLELKKLNYVNFR